MKVGLIGPPLCGKSTLFMAITGQAPDPAVALQEHTALIKVPDERLTYLNELYQPKKLTHATIEFCDYPGISSTDERGKQQLKTHLPHIRQCDILAAVVRDFQNPAVPPHKDRIDPLADLNLLYEDFIFADLEAVTGRLDRLEKSLKKPTRSHDHDKKEQALLLRCQEKLEALEPLSAAIEHDDEKVMLRSFAFLTEKPVVAVINVSEGQAATEPACHYPSARAILNICAEAEAQIVQLDSAADQAAFLQDLGIAEPARNRLIRTAYAAGGLMSFLTVGPDEVRAWTVRQNATAVDAAGKIHSDLARGFIRAETVHYDDLVAAGGDMKAVKSAGKLRQEGKTYLVQDGDIINFKFNV